MSLIDDYFKEFYWDLDDPEEYKRMFEKWFYLNRWVDFDHGSIE